MRIIHSLGITWVILEGDSRVRVVIDWLGEAVGGAWRYHIMLSQIRILVRHTDIILTGIYGRK